VDRGLLCMAGSPCSSAIVRSVTNKKIISSCFFPPDLRPLVECPAAHVWRRYNPHCIDLIPQVFNTVSLPREDKIMDHKTRILSSPRNLTLWEKEIIDRLLSCEFQGKDALVRQLKTIHVNEECNACKTIGLLVDHEPGNLAVVHYRIPVQAEAIDVDGITIHFLLHVVDGFIDELEVFREDDEIIKSLPQPNTLNILNLDDENW
jgi:Domain of unknown function (DUF6984)